MVKRSQERFKRNPDATKHYESLRAQDELMTNFLKVMADYRLDAIVYKSVEHQPTLIKDGIAPPFTDQKGAPHLNTFLVYVPTITVPAGFTRDNLPAGLCFIGRPYDDGNLIKYAYAYEQATHHRRPPATRQDCDSDRDIDETLRTQQDRGNVPNEFSLIRGGGKSQIRYRIK